MRLYHSLLTWVVCVFMACQPQTGNTYLNQNLKDTLYKSAGTKHPVPVDVHLTYTKHAHCRMDCRHITEHEIYEVLRRGTENVHSTEAHEHDKGGHCPKYTLEAKTDEGQKLRVVFAYCKGDQTAAVVTCIDLGTEWQCDCH